MEKKKIKCVVWDLDNTLWEGTLSEGDDVALKPESLKILEEFDQRGILQSISSKNNFEDAKDKLEQLGIWKYFIYPKINWNSKSDSVAEIAKDINIGIDTLAFVDDQIFEREEVQFSHPEVYCIDAADMGQILELERLKPLYITSDSKNRRKLYQTDIERNSLEEQYKGTKEEFLRTLQMKFTISRAKEEDLQRAEELTVRTHQLNSTGYVYSYAQLKEFILSNNHEVLVAQLDDKFGSYGKIGLALIEKRENIWELKLLLMSCRVMAKGVGNVFMNYIINLARANHVTIRAQFVPTDRNRIMYITYKFNGFKEAETTEDLVIFEANMSYERVLPDYIQIIDEGV